MSTEGKWLEVLLFLDRDDHLLKIIWGDMSFSGRDSGFVQNLVCGFEDELC